MNLPVQKELRQLSDPAKAKILQSFFKTGPGEYGEGDVFLGVVVPKLRALAKKYEAIPFENIKTLLTSGIHEERLLALFVLVRQYKKGDDSLKEKIYNFYLNHRRYVNNWDLVDQSAHHIIGDYLQERDKEILLALSASKNIWDRRISMVATYYFICSGQPRWTLILAERLLGDEEDLIHKAAGWMLREVGKRCSEEVLERFLERHAASMPRTMLRYSIERFTADKRRYYLMRDSEAVRKKSKLKRERPDG